MGESQSEFNDNPVWSRASSIQQSSKRVIEPTQMRACMQHIYLDDKSELKSRKRASPVLNQQNSLILEPLGGLFSVCTRRFIHVKRQRLSNVDQGRVVA